jgi:hypothetical protein
VAPHHLHRNGQPAGQIGCRSFAMAQKKGQHGLAGWWGSGWLWGGRALPMSIAQLGKTSGEVSPATAAVEGWTWWRA